MTTELGTELGTTLGTILSSMEIEGAPAFDASKFYALTGVTSANTYATQAGGGEAGDAAGFGQVVLCYIERIPLAAQPILRRSTTGQGYTLSTDATAPGFVYTTMNSGTGVATGSRLNVGLALSPSDVGKVIPFITSYNGSLIGTAGWDHSLKKTVAMTGYTPATTQATTLGSTSADGSVVPVASFSYRGTPTDPQMAAVFAAIRTARDLPSKAAIEALMPGTTVTHRWSLRDVLQAANLPVADGSAAPASIPDSVTGASVDAMGKVGSPTIRAIDPGAYPRTSYGVYGAPASWFATAQNTGLVGSAGGFSVAVIADLVALAATTTGTLYSQNAGDARGLAIYMISAVTLRFLCYDGAGSAVVADAALTAADVGKQLFVAQHDGTTLKLYGRGGVQLATANITGYTAQTTNAYVGVGGYPVNNSPLAGGSVYDVATSSTPLSSGEIAQLFADYDRTGALVPNAKHTHRWPITAAVGSNGGPANGVPASIPDTLGGNALTRSGTGHAIAQRTERLYSYETTPILYGAKDFAANGYYDSAATGHDGGAAGKSVALLLRIDSQAVSKTRDLLAIGTAASEGAVQVRFSGTNSSAMGVYWTGSGYAGTPSAVFTAADVGKLILLVTTWDQPAGRVRMYSKRAEVSTGTAAAALAPYAGSRLRIGHISNAPALNATFFGEGLSVFGVSTWDGTWTLSEVQALFDATMAAESLQAVAGKTDHLYRFPSGAANSVPDLAGSSPLSLVGAVANAEQYARAWAW